MNVPYNHYGNQVNDIYQDDSTPAETIISTLEQEVEFCTFDEAIKELNDQAQQSRQKVLKSEIMNQTKRYT